MEVIYTRCRDSLDHITPLGLMRERYLSHWATRLGKDSNPGRQHRRPKRSRLNKQCHSAPSSTMEALGGKKREQITIYMSLNLTLYPTASLGVFNVTSVRVSVLCVYLYGNAVFLVSSI